MLASVHVTRLPLIWGLIHSASRKFLLLSSHSNDWMISSPRLSLEKQWTPPPPTHTHTIPLQRGGGLESISDRRPALEKNSSYVTTDQVHAVRMSASLLSLALLDVCSGPTADVSCFFLFLFLFLIFKSAPKCWKCISNTRGWWDAKQCKCWLQCQVQTATN